MHNPRLIPRLPHPLTITPVLSLMGCDLAADEIRGKYRPGLEVCGIIYELLPRADRQSA